MVNGPP